MTPTEQSDALFETMKVGMVRVVDDAGRVWWVKMVAVAEQRGTGL